jgi:pilus assembly protein Flp/PilA
MQFMRKILRDNKGATAIEYGLIAALIAVAAIGAMTTLGSNLRQTFTTVSGNLAAGGGGGGTPAPTTP